jgi:redox-sensitive bicupin YhaK (pirin superfamily)
VRVVAGNFQGVKGTASTFTPINVWDVTLTADQTVDLLTTEGHTSIIFCRTGSVKAGSSTTSIKSAQIAMLSREGTGKYS